jgi:hypothetical protein
VHYGFERKSTKAGAKQALLEAFENNGRILEVPRDIWSLKQEMKKLFEVADVNEKREFYKEKIMEQRQQDKERYKRKREGDELMAEVAKAPRLNTDRSGDRDSPLDLARIQGFYTVTSPSLRSEWFGTDKFTIELALSANRSHL